jgi:hypothetical protein
VGNAVWSASGHHWLDGGDRRRHVHGHRGRTRRARGALAIRATGRVHPGCYLRGERRALRLGDHVRPRLWAEHDRQAKA